MQLVGQNFGRLVVVRELRSVHRTAGGTLRRVFECACICGRTTQVTLQGLRSGQTRSCGCLRRRDLTGPTTRASRARWAAYHRERRQRQQPIIDAFQAALQALMHERAKSIELMRLLWGGWGRKPSAFVEIFVKSRRLPTEEEANAIADMMNLRFVHRDAFLAAARKAREALVALEVARQAAVATPS